METFALRSGHSLPSIGFGTWKLSGKEATEAVLSALRVGYRHIDTADIYENHEAVAAAVRESGIARSDLFLTSKVWRDELSPAGVRDAATRFLAELETDYLDLLLIHWPNRTVPIGETLKAMDELRREGKVRSIGVSNFIEAHLIEVLDTNIAIDVNQVEFHPTFNQQELKSFCDEHDILVVAYSPLGQGNDVAHPTIVSLAKKYGRSPAQVILNWLVGSGIAVIPKATLLPLIEENFNARSFELLPEDRAAIELIDADKRLLNPAFAEFDKMSEV
jgi:diketogulonate reductase-like aldo/keto reductase